MTNIIDVSAVIRAITIATIIIGSLAGASSASAQDEPEFAGAPTRNPIIVYTQDATAGELGEQLVQRAEAEGVILVVVGLRLTMEMEHRLSDEEVAAQREVLRSVQSRVAARVLGSANAQGQVRFDSFPYMSMLVNSNQLRRLLADSEVVSVKEDVPMSPALGDSTGLTHADDVWAKGFNGKDVSRASRR